EILSVERSQDRDREELQVTAFFFGAGLCSLEHARPTGGVQRQVGHPELGGGGDGSVDGLGDVMELQIEEDLSSLSAERAHDLRTAADEELEADLQTPDIRTDLPAARLRFAGAVIVEREDQPFSGFFQRTLSLRAHRFPHIGSPGAQSGPAGRGFAAGALELPVERGFDAAAPVLRASFTSWPAFSAAAFALRSSSSSLAFSASPSEAVFSSFDCSSRTLRSASALAASSCAKRAACFLSAS